MLMEKWILALRKDAVDLPKMTIYPAVYLVMCKIHHWTPVQRGPARGLNLEHQTQIIVTFQLLTYELLDAADILGFRLVGKLPVRQQRAYEYAQIMQVARVTSKAIRITQSRCS